MSTGKLPRLCHTYKASFSVCRALNILFFMMDIGLLSNSAIFLIFLISDSSSLILEFSLPSGSYATASQRRSAGSDISKLLQTLLIVLPFSITIFTALALILHHIFFVYYLPFFSLSVILLYNHEVVSVKVSITHYFRFFSGEWSFSIVPLKSFSVSYILTIPK